MGKEWIKIKETGQLYLEKVIVSFDIPILFVCNDFENRKYLCLNIDDEIGTTIIAETDNKMLLNMLQDKVTMEYVFRNALNDRIMVAEYDSINKKIISKVENAKEISGDLLPEKEAFLDLSNKMILEYISFLDKQLIRVGIEKFSDKKTVTVHQVKYNSYFSSENKEVINCKNVKFTYRKTKSSYDVEIESKMIA